jgi:hypothetical protein
MVRYTENVLFIRNLKNGIPFKEVNRNLRQSVWTDGVKVRLLSKGLSIQMRKDEKNVAFGKAQSLSRLVQWQQPRDWALMVIHLFISRMGNLLPGPRKHPKIWYQVRLPPELGGLGLGVLEDIYVLVNSSPYPTQRVVAKILAGAMVIQESSLLKRLNSNRVARGSRRYREKADRIMDKLLEGKYPLGSVHSLLSWDDVLAKYAERKLEDARHVVSFARADNILTYEEFALRQARSDLFGDLLINRPVGNNFSTEEYWKRYRNIYSGLLDLTDGFEPPKGGFNPTDHPRLRMTIRKAFSGGFIHTREAQVSSRFGRTEAALGMEGEGLSAHYPN